MRSPLFVVLSVLVALGSIVLGFRLYMGPWTCVSPVLTSIGVVILIALAATKEEYK